MTYTEPSEGSRPVRAGVCDERQRRIDENLERLSDWARSHEGDHAQARREQTQAARWTLGLLVTILLGLAALSGVVIRLG